MLCFQLKSIFMVWITILFKNSRNQVPNFGPHIPINPFRILNSIKNLILLIFMEFLLLQKCQVKNKNFLLKYFCRLLVIVCKAKIFKKKIIKILF